MSRHDQKQKLPTLPCLNCSDGKHEHCIDKLRMSLMNGHCNAVCHCLTCNKAKVDA